MQHIEKPDTFGKCIACDTNTAVLKNGRIQINNQYCEKKFMLSNNSIMRVAFCKSCVKKIRKRDFDWIMKNVILGWEESLKRKEQAKQDKYRKQFFGLKIKGYV